MSDRPMFDPDAFFEPMQDLLRGEDPVEVARRAGVTVEELFRRRETYLRIKANQARNEEVALQRVGRNEPCPCGSGRKYKKCCMLKHQETISKRDPEELRLLAHRAKAKAEMEVRAREGYRLLTSGDHQKARAFAQRWLASCPEDDRLHDVLATCAMQQGDVEEAVRITRSRWESALKEKEFFLSHGRHSYDDPQAPLGHAYSPKAWLERHWVALKARGYASRYPERPDPRVLAQVRELQKADDLARFPQQQEEGLRVRREALSEAIEALQATGPEALAYLMPICVRYGWAALLVPEILAQWGDDASIRALVEVSVFHYPFLSESCLRALEGLGEMALPFLQEAFQTDGEFDALKIGLISVAGQLGTPEALDWVMGLLDHSDPTVVNWAGGVLGEHGYVKALDKLRAASLRIGREPRMEWAIEELSHKKSD